MSERKTFVGRDAIQSFVQYAHPVAAAAAVLAFMETDSFHGLMVPRSAPGVFFILCKQNLAIMVDVEGVVFHPPKRQRTTFICPRGIGSHIVKL